MEVHTWPPGPQERRPLYLRQIFSLVFSLLPSWPVLHTLLSWLHYSHSALVTMKLFLPPFIFQHLHSQSPGSLPSQKLSNSSEIQNWNNKPKWGCNSTVKTPHVTALRNAKSVPSLLSLRILWLKGFALILNLVLASAHTKMGRDFLQTTSLGSQRSNWC